MPQFDREDICKLYPAPLNVVQKERFERLNRLIEAEGCNALVIAGSAMLGRRANLRFVSNFAPTTRHAVALYAPTAEPRLLVTYPIHLYWAGSQSWIQDVRLSKDVILDVVEWLAVAGGAKGVVGISGLESLGASFQEQLGAHLGKARLKSVDAAFAKTRMAKTPLDLQFLQLSTDIGDAAYDRVKQVAKPGITENDLVADIEWTMRKHGMENGLVLITSTSRHSTPIPSHRQLHAGDVIIISLEPAGPGGYIAQTQRSFSLGEPSKVIRETFDACRRVEECTRDALIAKSPVSRAARAGMEAFRQIGGSGQSMVLGHGLGIDVGEPPRVSEDDYTLLEAGMAIALHPSVYKENFGVGIGNAYEITEHGPRCMARTTSDLIVI